MRFNQHREYQYHEFFLCDEAKEFFPDFNQGEEHAFGISLKPSKKKGEIKVDVFVGCCSCRAKIEGKRRFVMYQTGRIVLRALLGKEVENEGAIVYVRHIPLTN